MATKKTIIVSMATLSTCECEGGDDTSSVTICSSGSTATIYSSTTNNNSHTAQPNNDNKDEDHNADKADNEDAHNRHKQIVSVSDVVVVNGGSTKAAFNGYTNHVAANNTEQRQHMLGCGLINKNDNVGNNTTSSIEETQQPQQQHVNSKQRQQEIAGAAAAALQPTTGVERSIATPAHNNSAVDDNPPPTLSSPQITVAIKKNLLLCRRFKDTGDTLRNFNSLPLFVYATSPDTHATSADGVGVAQLAVKVAEEAVAAANLKVSFFVYFYEFE